MRIVCAWCQNPIEVRCDHCAAPLLVTSYVGSTFEAGAMACLNGETPVIYSRAAIEAMPISHGMCAACGALAQEERDALIEKQRFNAGVAKEVAAIRADEKAAVDGRKHEAETRSLKKRGPTGGIESAKVRVPGAPKKDGGVE